MVVRRILLLGVPLLAVLSMVGIATAPPDQRPQVWGWWENQDNGPISTLDLRRNGTATLFRQHDAPVGNWELTSRHLLRIHYGNGEILNARFTNDPDWDPPGLITVTDNTGVQSFRHMQKRHPR